MSKHRPPRRTSTSVSAAADISAYMKWLYGGTSQNLLHITKRSFLRVGAFSVILRSTRLICWSRHKLNMRHGSTHTDGLPVAGPIQQTVMSHPSIEVKPSSRGRPP